MYLCFVLSSECVRLAHLVYLTITYQLVKLLATSVTMAAKNRVESWYMECGIFGIVTSWRMVWW